MYTGQLEYWTSEQTALYKTAEKMNMTVLTKLLDAQSLTPSLLASPPSSTVHEEKQMSLGQQSLNSYKKTNQELPSTPLPGRKLPIWRRKIDTPSSTSTATSSSSSSMNNSLNYGKRKCQSTSGPSRFELPDVDDMTLGVFSSFDDITYNTKPIVKAQKNNRDDNINNHTSYNRSLNIDTSKNDTTEDEDDDLKTIKQWDNDNNNSDDDWSGPKGILRDPVDGQQTPSKRVRFELEEKENLEKQEKNTNDSINNHAKIVREVLKKYPHLVKNHQNIRLKIMQKDNKSNDTNTPSKTKVSYVVLKSDHLMGDNNDDTQMNKTQTSDAGVNGIWKCPKCDISQEYTKYYMYRRHMQDVHEEKFDPRICEHCGYKATKRNILMYHMYTKHNIQPPKNMSFPKCHACNYVALSETLLARHQISHNHGQTSRYSRDEIQCVDCPLKFTDINDLASHEISSGHGKVTNSKEHRGYRCKVCSKCFVRPVNLQTHLQTMHKNLHDNEEYGLPIFRSTLEPSSEAEALSTVASGIAASLGVDNNDDDDDNNMIITDNNIIITDSNQQQQIVATSDGDYLVPEIDINQLTPDSNFNGQMIYLIDDNTYQQQQLQVQHQQPQQLELSGNEQIVMQGTDDGMLVYIAGNDDITQEQIDNQIYQTYAIEQNDNQITEEEEILEEEVEEEVVEEVEEVVEEIVEEINDTVDNNSQHNDGGNNDGNVEDDIQYVEETEIVEYDDEQVNNEQNQNEQDLTKVIEEEQIDNQDDKIKEGNSAFAAEWDESSEEVHES